MSFASSFESSFLPPTRASISLATCQAQPVTTLSAPETLRRGAHAHHLEAERMSCRAWWLAAGRLYRPGLAWYPSYWRETRRLCPDGATDHSVFSSFQANILGPCTQGGGTNTRKFLRADRKELRSTATSPSGTSPAIPCTKVRASHHAIAQVSAT